VYIFFTILGKTLLQFIVKIIFAGRLEETTEETKKLHGMAYVDVW
jgi:hypothetical protein